MATLKPVMADVGEIDFRRSAPTAFSSCQTPGMRAALTIARGARGEGPVALCRGAVSRHIGFGGPAMTSVSFTRIGLAASIAGLLVFSAEAVSAAPPTSACPGDVSIGPTANLLPAPARMPLNCTVAFSDGAVNFAGQVTGQATDGFTMTTTMYDQLGRVVGVTNSLSETIVLTPERGELSTITDPAATPRHSVTTLRDRWPRSATQWATPRVTPTTRRNAPRQ